MDTKVKIPVNDSEGGNSQDVVDTCKKYCKQEWIGMAPVLKAILVDLEALTEEDDLPEDIVMLAKQTHFDNKLKSMQKSDDDSKKYAY